MVRHPTIIVYFVRISLDISSSKFQGEPCLFGHKFIVITSNSSELHLKDYNGLKRVFF